MDRNTLTEKLAIKTAHELPHYTDSYIKESHMNYIDFHRKNNPDEILVIPMEEMAELTQHLSKLMRNKESSDDIGLLEELVDVQICIDNLKLYLNIDEEKFKYVMDIKLERSNKKIESGNA